MPNNDLINDLIKSLIDNLRRTAGKFSIICRMFIDIYSLIILLCCFIDGNPFRKGFHSAKQLSHHRIRFSMQLMLAMPISQETSRSSTSPYACFCLLDSSLAAMALLLMSGGAAKKELDMFQQLILVGHLGTTPEMRYTSSGTPVTNFRLAVNRRWTNNEGQLQEKTTWFSINLWERRAEIAAQYLAKGSKVMIIGEVDRAHPWQDRDGNLQASIEVTATQFRFLDGRSDAEHGNNGTSTQLVVQAGDQTSTDEQGDIPF